MSWFRGRPDLVLMPWDSEFLKGVKCYHQWQDRSLPAMEHDLPPELKRYPKVSVMYTKQTKVHTPPSEKARLYRQSAWEGREPPQTTDLCSLTREEVHFFKLERQILRLNSELATAKAREERLPLLNKLHTLLERIQKPYRPLQGLTYRPFKGLK